MFIAFACEAICPELLFVIQFLSHVQLFETPWITAHQASLSFIVSQRLLKLMSIESMMPSNHIILCHLPLFLPFMFSQHQGPFQWVSSLHQAKVLELQDQFFQ